ncbi:MAG: prepilin-type N-terminal cleavage/methylation domain-containing protein [Candidatus Paceibacterota bacterium]|jgi:prepilin-type N-terminal cleavage/methylation domain-containing protein
MKTINKGFTLIELLVVIAIIGLLSTIVVASLSTVRKKARDTKRVADVKSLQLALELFFDTNRQYPTSTSATGFAPTFISSIPKDPLGTNYFYAGTGTSAATCSSYHLGALLEDTANAALLTDSDQAAGAVAICTGSNAQFSGLTTDCALTAGVQGSTELCYDITN